MGALNKTGEHSKIEVAKVLELQVAVVIDVVVLTGHAITVVEELQVIFADGEDVGVEFEVTVPEELLWGSGSTGVGCLVVEEV